MGADESEVAKLIPARLVIELYMCKKCGCPKGHAIVIASKPTQVVPSATYDASVYAHVATTKYVDQPLHRIEVIFKRHGIPLPKQTH